jgi:hypothetical protein
MENQTKTGIQKGRRRTASEKAGRKPARTPQSERKPRSCLMCSRNFDSDGAHNRICRRCKASQTYRGA